ncbi:signal peptide peptidase SppA [Photobacterium sp. 1_MG-2023]|uniref:signal peptide peptidase SppA n=1 Tax=Photobacterium sp. 1_MG-2023 TaxID=3062646 RepID=UPI0026E11C81|nr:signal peptide peptidase SppA [Photobacterium sp. 1_MG-2023]MDO6707101.1 signal peptide peptidase SppA [Photobacterium sp. 1_MG-2023]
MKVLLKGIAKVLRGGWKLLSFTRQLFFNLIFLALVGVIIFIFQQGSDEPVLPEKAALVLDLDGPIVEKRSYVNPFDQVVDSALGQVPVQENVLFDVVDTIRAAAKDENITGLILNLKGMPETNLTKLRYIAKAIEEFKQAGKPVYAVGDHYRQSQYYLASYADKVFLSPDGGVLLTGYGSYSLYYKSLLEKLDVTTHVFRVGTYKSFVEPYTRDNMSDAAREANTAWLNQMWQAYTQDVARNRQIDASVLTPDVPDLVEALKGVQGDFARLSQKMGLVDELVSRTQLRQQFIKEFGSDGDHGFNQISYYDYLPTVASPFGPSKNGIAVVVASGAIVDGQQGQGSIGGDTTAAQLREARLDDSIKAVILRVDSPGGSAFASEVIRNEVDALKLAGKPVVVSMSSLAASGGYWISSSASEIIAQPTTITGSIGIFGILATFEKGLENMGVYSDGVGTTPFAGIGITRGLPDDVAQVFQLGIENGYQRFISLVSENRHLSLEETDKIAQGRVWTGQDALKLGLVDRLGDFDDAIVSAAKLAKLDDYDLRWIDIPLSPLEQFMQEMTSEASAAIGQVVASQVPSVFQPALKQIATDISGLNQLNDPKGQYAFCLNCSSTGQ